MAGRPYTLREPGQGTNTLTVTLPAGVSTDVQSVVADIDASAAGRTHATLTIADQNGAVIAEVPIGEAIPGGGQGRATWARRLADAAAALATTDGVSTVDPTAILRIANGLFLQPGPGGQAVIGTLPGLFNLVAHWNAAANTNGVPRPLVLDTAVSLDLGGVPLNRIDVPADGYYLCVLDGSVIAPAPAAAGVPLGIHLIGNVHGFHVETVVPIDAAVAAGASRQLSVAGMIFITGSEGMQVFVNGDAATGTGGGTVSLVRLF